MVLKSGEYEISNMKAPYATVNRPSDRRKVLEASTIVTTSTLYSQSNLSLHFFIIHLRTRHSILLAGTVLLHLMPDTSSYGSGCPLVTISRKLGATRLPHTALPTVIYIYL